MRTSDFIIEYWRRLVSRCFLGIYFLLKEAALKNSSSRLGDCLILVKFEETVNYLIIHVSGHSIIIQTFALTGRTCLPLILQFFFFFSKCFKLSLETNVAKSLNSTLALLSGNFLEGLIICNTVQITTWCVQDIHVLLNSINKCSFELSDLLYDWPIYQCLLHYDWLIAGKFIIIFFISTELNTARSLFSQSCNKRVGFILLVILKIISNLQFEDNFQMHNL